MLDTKEKSSREAKSCVDFRTRRPRHGRMDDLDTAREHVVQAIACMEDAISEALPAQAPTSGRDEIASGVVAARRKIEEVMRWLARAESALEDVR